MAQRTGRVELLDLADLGRETMLVGTDGKITVSKIPDAIWRDVSGYDFAAACFR